MDHDTHRGHRRLVESHHHRFPRLEDKRGFEGKRCVRAWLDLVRRVPFLGGLVRVLCAKLGPMTTREKAHKLLEELPESEIEPVVEFIVSRRERGSVDEWGDLDAWSDAASKDTMRMLDEEEAAAGFSWEENRPA
jgi:hypothetical protein